MSKENELIHDDFFDYSSFKEDILEKLGELSVNKIRQFVWRIGVLSIPILGGKGHFNLWDSKDVQKYLYAIFFAIDSCQSPIVTSDQSLIETMFHSGDTINGYLSDVSFSLYYMYRTHVTIDEDNLRERAARSVARAADGAHTLNIDLTSRIDQEIKSKPLQNIEYNEIWSNFFLALEKEGCSYWGAWIQQIIESGFKVDKRKLERHLNVPPEIQEQGAARVAKYLENLEKGAHRLNEARIIILGDKGAGKTSIARKLVDLDAELPTPDESTPGVDTIHWELPDKDFNVRIWDFAGHTVTHAVHQFFLSERSLYILVCSGRTEEYNRLEYWLSQMQIYGGNSEVIILVNIKDKHKHSVPINRLKKKYPITHFVDYSIKDDEESMITFRRLVMDYVVGHPNWAKQEIPDTYYQVKEELESLFQIGDLENGKERIDRSAFNKIAEKYNVEDADGLLRDLHHLGISLWYEEMEEVDTLVLNPEWISFGIYSIINWTHNQGKHGLTLSQFKSVFKAKFKRYPEEEHKFLFELMKHYELAFETTQRGARYLIIPHLLEEDQPFNNDLPSFELDDSLMIKYKSDTDLPAHTISRFIVKHHDQIEIKGKKYLVWKYGVVLSDGGGNVALVQEDNRTISVSVKGPEMTDYLSKLRSTLNGIFDVYKKNKPELLCRVRHYGEFFPGEEEAHLWLADKKILNQALDNVPYYDEKSREHVDLNPIAEQYNIKADTVIVKGENHRLHQDRRVFNFKDCNVTLQGALNELSQELADDGKHEASKQIENIASAVEQAKACKTPEEVKSKGLIRRLERFTKKLSDERSDLHKVVKHVENGVSIAQDIAESYNDLAQWCGLPQVPKPFLKKGN